MARRWFRPLPAPRCPSLSHLRFSPSHRRCGARARSSYCSTHSYLRSSSSRSLRRGTPGSSDHLPIVPFWGPITMTSRVALKVAMRAAGNSPGAAGGLGAALSGRGSLWAPVAPAMASVGASRGQSSPTAVAMEEQVRWVNLKVVRERMKTVSNIGKVRRGWG